MSETKEKTTLHSSCYHCDKTQSVEVNRQDLSDWCEGKKLIEVAFPYLNKEQRQIIKGSICGYCWHSLFENKIFGMG